MKIYFVGEFDDRVKEEYKQFWFIKDEGEYSGNWYYKIRIEDRDITEYKDWELITNKETARLALKNIEEQRYDVLIYWDCMEYMRRFYKRKLYKYAYGKYLYSTDSYPGRDIEFFLWEEYKNERTKFEVEDKISWRGSYYVVRTDSIIDYNDYWSFCENFKVVDKLECDVESIEAMWNHRDEDIRNYLNSFNLLMDMDIRNNKKIEILKILKRILYSWINFNRLIYVRQDPFIWHFGPDYLYEADKLEKIWLSREEAMQILYPKCTTIAVYPTILKEESEEDLNTLK